MRKILVGRKKLFAVLVCAAMLGVAPSAANGGTIVVRADGTGDYSTIQDAIDAAVAGDEVVLEPGTYTGPGNRDIDFLGKAITVRSSDPNDPDIVAATIIDCNGTEAEPHRGFYFHSGEGSSSILSGFTVRKGFIYDSGAKGGGIYCSGSSPTIQSCIIEYNSAYGKDGHSANKHGTNGCGGGIYCTSSSPTIIECQIRNNTVQGGDALWDIWRTLGNGGLGCGAGIYCDSNSNPTIRNSTIVGNIAQGGKGGVPVRYHWGGNGGHSYGAGIYCDSNSNPTIIDSTIADNVARSGEAGRRGNEKGHDGNGQGGGIYCTDSSPTINNCKITDNSAYKYSGVGGSGGGIYCVNGRAEINDCIVNGNWTKGRGGGIYCENSNLTIKNCKINKNQVSSFGGGIFCNASNPVITNCSISENTGADYGGGVYCASSSPNITNCIVNGVHCAEDSDPNISNCIITKSDVGIFCERNSDPNISYCVISNNFTGIFCCYQSSPKITHCVVKDNKSGYLGGGVIGSQGPITNCIITGNTSNEEGGGLFNCSGPITNCVVSNNKGQYEGGGIYFCSGPIINCVISNNTAEGGGGISRCDGPITNCVIVNNTSGGLSYCSGEITNCIIWDNSPYQICYSSNVTYCDVQGGWLGEGNIDADPLFTSDTDYHLMPASPCIDTGDPNYIPSPNETDLDGNPRVIGDAIDIGVYEYIHNSPSIAVSARRFYFIQDWPKREPQILLIRNCGGQPLYWKIVEDCNWLEVAPPNGVSIDQINEVTITVDPNGLTPGIYTYSFEIQDPNAANNPVSIPVTMPVGTVLPVPSPNYPTIQDAIDAADYYDIVLVADGNYTGPGNKNLDYHGKPITVCSENGPANCIIDCENLGRGFYFHGGENENSTVNGFTITNAGIGIFCIECGPTIKNCFINGNNGEGILCYQRSSPIVTNCTITGSGSNGIYSRDGGATITNCTISNNGGCGISAGDVLKIKNCTIVENQMGGASCERAAIDNSTISYNFQTGISCSGELKIDNSTISGNTAGSYGWPGGISCGENSTIKNCIISGNSAEFIGGISCGENSTITNCIISGNSATEGIGGIWCANATITNCIITGNTAKRTGGICCNLDATITNCTITGNLATDREWGGAIYCYNCNTEISNCILWDNQAPVGPQIYVDDGSNASLSYTDIQGGQADIFVEPGGTLNWGIGNINLDPDFAFSADYHLMPDSPCIDAGDPNYIANPEETDLDGNPRIIDGNDDTNAVIDMGAHEFNPNYPSIAVSATSFYFINDWPDTAPQTLSIRNCGGGTLRWEIIEDCNWLDVAPPNGISDEQINEVTLTVDPNGLALGLYSCNLTVQDPNASNNPVTVQVEFRVRSILRVPSQDYLTIQDAIDAADDYDMVLVADGTYTGEGNKNLDYYGKALTVRSENGPNNCIIDCETLGRGFYFHSDEGADSILKGFTITNGSAPEGGGIYCRYSSPMITNCTITGNTATDYGAGVYCIHSSNPTIKNCTISGNSAANGGGITCRNYSTPTITNCTISNNSASDGGGIRCGDSSPVVTNCTITGNYSAFSGGGLSGCDGPITNCIIANNTGYGYGGGLYRCNGPITNCIINNNTANMRGGGGLFFCDGPIINCTIIGNSADKGGGMFDCDGPITNCIIRDNTALEGPQLYSSDTPNYSCVQNWTTGGEGNIDTDPCFVQPGYWVDVNDPNIIVEPNDPNAVWLGGDYHLRKDSPCIDAGDPNFVPGPNETDLDGNARILDGDNDGNSVVDMGAYEYRPPAPVELIEQLIEEVAELELPRGIENSLKVKLNAALRALEDDNEYNDVAAINTLQAFINAVEAQRGKKIPEAGADALIVAAQEIIELLSME